MLAKYRDAVDELKEKIGSLRLRAGGRGLCEADQGKLDLGTHHRSKALTTLRLMRGLNGTDTQSTYRSNPLGPPLPHSAH